MSSKVVIDEFRQLKEGGLEATVYVYRQADEEPRFTTVRLSRPIRESEVELLGEHYLLLPKDAIHPESKLGRVRRIYTFGEVIKFLKDFEKGNS